jgi:hypothetical protein
MELDKKRIEDAIIADVADKIIGEDDLYSRVKKAVEQRIDALFKDKADAQIAAAIEDAIRNGFDREYCRISSWGERQGEPTTIRKELEKLISGYWNEKVDRHGKPTSYSSTNDITRAEWLMTQLVANDFKDDMKQHVVNITAGLKDGLRKELHKTVNQLLSGTFHVKSLDDQKLDGMYNPHPEAK